MELFELRQEIDRIDKQFVDLFLKRMELCKQIAIYKSQNGLCINVPGREEEVLRSVQAHAGEEMCEYALRLYAALFELSKEYQEQTINNEVK